MNTDELIERLSADRPPSALLGPTTTISLAVAASSVVVLGLAASWVGTPSELLETIAAGDHHFFLNIAFLLCVLGVAYLFVRDLSVPGRRLRMPIAFALAPLVMMVVLALHELGSVSLAQWPHHVPHESWLTCIWQVGVLAIPAFAILSLAVRRLAPTDLSRAGLYIGLLSGGLGAMGYLLCTGDDNFVLSSTAYVVVIVSMAFVGALVGPRLLRWS